MNDDELELEVRAFVAKTVGLPLSKIISTTDVVDDAKIYGDDVFQLVEGFGERFHVDVTSFRWYHHTGPECVSIVTNIRSLFSKPWWARKTYVPIRLSDLVESAKRGAWVIQYPEREFEASHEDSSAKHQWQRQQRNLNDHITHNL
ncbi:MAG: DUF1493 family protein [Verrucomicrobiota bacterium]